MSTKDKLVFGVPITAMIPIMEWARFLTYNFPNIPEINVTPLSIDKENGYLPDNVDFVIFDGGADVHPSFYGEMIKPCTFPNVYRDKVEKGIYDFYKNKNTKFLGICRGLQFLNVMSKGTLYQDLSQVNKGHCSPHNVKIVDSKLIKLLDTSTILVNSLHHQAVKKLGNNLKPTMIETTTNIIEGFCSINGDKIRAVQSHPEFLGDNYPKALYVLKWLLRLDTINA